jgi:cephalosporin hydroxylase
MKYFFRTFIRAVRSFNENGKPWDQWYRFFGPARTNYTTVFNSWKDMSLKEWLLYYHKKILRAPGGSRATWLGVPILKNPLDAWIYQEIIFKVKPDFIIEIGSYDGGSTVFFASLLDLLGNGKVISIDIDRSHYLAKHSRIIEVTGDSSSEEVVTKVKEICKNGRVLVSHDGDHQTERVLQDLNLYADLVSKGSYFVVEDGITDMFRAGEGMSSAFAGGPLLAIERFLKERKDFIIDKEQERHLVTYHPSGFLKKI